MIYGYDSGVLNEDGLKQMREISIASGADNLRELAAFLLQAADDMEQAKSAQWHRHVLEALQQALKCDVIVATAFIDV
jgi:hypothetical protein